MDSDALVARRYEAVLKLLSTDDAECVQAYQNDKLRSEYERGQNQVRRTNGLKTLGSIALMGLILFACSFLLWATLRDAPCPEVVACPEAAKTSWQATQNGYHKLSDDTRFCLYNNRTMTCWLKDVPDEIPAPPAP